MIDRQLHPSDKSAQGVPQVGILRRILKVFNGGLFTRMAVLFGAAQRIVPPAP